MTPAIIRVWFICICLYFVHPASLRFSVHRYKTVELLVNGHNRVSHVKLSKRGREMTYGSFLYVEE